MTLTAPKEIAARPRRQGHRRALPAHGARRLRQERPAPSGRGPRPRLRRRLRPGHRRHRPVPRRQGPARRPAGGDCSDGWLKTDPRTGATTVDWVFAGGDAATGPGLGGRSRGRRRESRRGHRQVPHRREPRLLASTTSPSTSSSIPTPIRWTTQRAAVDCLDPRHAPAPSTRSSCPWNLETRLRRSQALPALRLRQDPGRSR